MKKLNSGKILTVAEGNGVFVLFQEWEISSYTVKNFLVLYFEYMFNESQCLIQKDAYLPKLFV